MMQRAPYEGWVDLDGGDRVRCDRMVSGTHREAAMPIRILVVEDLAANRECYRDWLDMHRPEFEVVGEAGDGEEAARLAERLRPDMALVDFRQTIRRIKECAPETRCVIFTAYVDADDLARCLQAGAAGYVFKGVHTLEVLDALRRAHSGSLVVALGPAEVEAAEQRTQEAALTTREREVLALIGEGLTNKEIAVRLDVSVSTVETHANSAMRKIGATSRAQAAAMYARTGKP